MPKLVLLNRLLMIFISFRKWVWIRLSSVFHFVVVILLFQVADVALMFNISLVGLDALCSVLSFLSCDYCLVCNTKIR
jgi:hypothetical protein